MKRFRNNLTFLLVSPLMVFSLLGHGAASSLVLCIGENDHLAIELNDACSNEAVTEISHSDERYFALLDGDHRDAHCHCLSIPLLIGSPYPSVSSPHYASQLDQLIQLECAAWRDRASALHLAGPPLPTPQLAPYALPVLRTTVLLI